MRQEEQQHVALPKLYGAPAYGRPVHAVEDAPRPFNPDDLPLSAHQTNEERDWIDSLPSHAYRPGGGVLLGQQPDSQTGADAHVLRGRPFRLRALAGRVFGAR